MARPAGRGRVGGRPPIDTKDEQRILGRADKRAGILKIAKKLGDGHSTVVRIKASMPHT
jgi:DNA invertase Pin-like site-specific DNA recombinase